MVAVHCQWHCQWQQWRTGALAQWPQNREPRASASGRRAAGRATGHWQCSATASSGSDGQLTVFKS